MQFSWDLCKKLGQLDAHGESEIPSIAGMSRGSRHGVNLHCSMYAFRTFVMPGELMKRRWHPLQDKMVADKMTQT